MEIRQKKPIRVFYLSSCQYKIPFLQGVLCGCVLIPYKTPVLRSPKSCVGSDPGAAGIGGRAPTEFSSSWIRTGKKGTNHARWLLASGVFICKSAGAVRGLSVQVLELQSICTTEMCPVSAAWRQMGWKRLRPRFLLIIHYSFTCRKYFQVYSGKKAPEMYFRTSFCMGYSLAP